MVTRDELGHVGHELRVEQVARRDAEAHPLQLLVRVRVRVRARVRVRVRVS